jgi:hypothetical protein
MSDTSMGETMVLVDGNDDGTFEPPPIVGRHEDLVTSGLLEPSQLLDSFTGH